MRFEVIKKTVKESIEIHGKGLHSGLPVLLEISPGSQGINFYYKGVRVPAIPENVSRTTLCTCLGEISTVEHLMSALAGVEITEAEIELSSPELPAMDGASAEFCKMLLEVGAVELATVILDLSDEPVEYIEEDIKIRIQPGTGKISYCFDTGERWPGLQEYSIDFSQETYLSEIAPARTFGFEEQLQQIFDAGLAKGLDKSTALVLGKEGYLNEAKFIDEPARHKLLDLIGDLYLAGIPMQYLDIVSIKSGHRSNVEAAKKLSESFKLLSSCH